MEEVPGSKTTVDFIVTIIAMVEVGSEGLPLDVQVSALCWYGHIRIFRKIKM